MIRKGTGQSRSLTVDVDGKSINPIGSMGLVYLPTFG